MTEALAGKAIVHPLSTGSAAAHALRLAQECAQTLASATGYKALLRRFGELLSTHAGVRTLTFARISRRRHGLLLKRRAIRLGAGLATHGDTQIEALTQELERCEPTLAVFREGYGHFQCDGTDYTLVVVEDPSSQEGTLIIWQAVLEPGGERDGARLPVEVLPAFLDLLIRHVQGECRWFKKLDKTQALLYRDDLTGLFNYRYFEIALDTELRRAERFSSQFCLLFIDLDGFKPINDQHGHLSGSSVLRQVADVLREAVREVDIPIRYGGDEFVVVLLGATCAKGVLVAERVRRLIAAREFRLDSGGIARLTASLGVAAFPEHGRDRDTLLRKADETMYDSKRSGKNRVTVVGNKTL